MPGVLTAAGGLLFHVDPLGAFFLAVVAIGGLSCPHARLSDSAQRVIDLHNGTWRQR